MEYRQLGQTDIAVSPIALGCWAFAGGAYWGPQDERDSIATVHAALDEGVNFFDTAAGYGPSEDILGRALQGRRDQAVIATKVRGTGAAAEIAAACENSLVQLNTDYIDLYQIHWPCRDTPLAETVGAFEQLQQQGKIRAFGVCNFGVQDLGEWLALGPCAADQLPYNLLTRGIEYQIQDLCTKRDVGIICYTPLAQGLLTGRYANANEVPGARAISRHFAGQRPGARHGEAGCEEAVFAALAKIADLADELGQSMAALALAWTLHQSGVTSLLCGARLPEEIRQNMAGTRLALGEDTLAALDRVTREVKAELGANVDIWALGTEPRIR